jgi:6-phosphogluconate dehydrogenase (decarboxylating)
MAMCAAPVRMRRDISNIQAALVDAGRASWLCSEALAEQVQLLQADAPVATRVASLAEAELQAAAQAVRQLVTTP